MYDEVVTQVLTRVRKHSPKTIDLQKESALSLISLL